MMAAKALPYNGKPPPGVAVPKLMVVFAVVEFETAEFETAEFEITWPRRGKWLGMCRDQRRRDANNMGDLHVWPQRSFGEG
jgi:hypothetical protein